METNVRGQMKQFVQICCLLLSILFITLPKQASYAAALSQENLLGYKSIPYTDLKPFNKWTKMLDRYQRNLADPKINCTTTAAHQCLSDEWKKFLNPFKNLSPEEQVQKINTLFNRSPYITDTQNWGILDYWETPFEFLRKSGDCEDYAIIKYMSLKYLGFSDDNLRIVILNDLNLKTAHAVLAVWIQNDFLILDNQIKQAISQNRIRHYQPIYSISEKGWWLHKPL